ncbi:EamA family transporter [Rheinheimera sp. UJ51]|uniref:DMT family transporter n=1 Tax=Rheinheimera sp. UJ51 TaxID=2892446 RepID=UPI001E5F0197|nr:EamA family transporter [Rheinheimera sp. UJ51]MCC5450725.1 EamA family transporter [Rheinheimera sp. UJ51]
MASARFHSILAVIVASFLWGTTGTVAHFSPDISPLAIGAFAMGGGGVLLCILARKELDKNLPLMRKMPIVLIGGGLCVALYPLAFYTAMRWSGVAIGTVVSIASAPLFSAILERLFCKKNVSARWCVSFVIGASGVVLLSMGKSADGYLPIDVSLQRLGIMLGLVAGLTYAAYSLLVKHMINKGVSSTSSMAGIFGIAATLLLPSLFFTGENLFRTPENTLVVLYMAFVPMFLGYLLFGFGLKSVEVSSATLITLIEPLVATLLAVWIVGEVFTFKGWLGMLLVCVCIVIQSVNFKSALRSAY